MSSEPACVGCGYCCQQATCFVGQAHGADVKGCKFLVHRDGRFWCQLVLDECVSKFSLAIDTGCSSLMFNTQRDEQLKALRIRTPF